MFQEERQLEMTQFVVVSFVMFVDTMRFFVVISFVIFVGFERVLIGDTTQLLFLLLFLSALLSHLLEDRPCFFCSFCWLVTFARRASIGDR